MSDYHKKYEDILNHFTEPDTPLKQISSDEEQITEEQETEQVAQSNEETQDTPSVSINPLSEELEANITSNTKKSYPWIKIVCAIVLIVCIVTAICAVFSPRDDKTNLFTDGMVSFQETDPETLNPLYGIINKRGKVLVKADYSMTYPAGENVIVAAEGSESVSFYTGSGAALSLITKKGKSITDFVFDGTSWEFSEGLMAVSKDQKWGFVSPKGKWVIKPQYAEARSFEDSLAPVRDIKTLKWGYINKKGNKVIKCKFDEVGDFSDSMAPAKKDGKWGYINKKGDWVIKNKFSDVGEFEDGMAIAINKDGKWGFINPNGEWIIEPEYEELKSFSENLSAAKKDGKWGYINKKGKWVIKNQFASLGSFENGLSYAQKNSGGKFGYINKKGDFVINAKYLMASQFSDGIALVKAEKGFGYIDKKGKKITETDFVTATVFFDDGYAAVCESDPKSPIGEKWYIINRKGKPIFSKTFDGIY